MSFRTALRAARPLTSLPRAAGASVAPLQQRSAALAFRRNFNESSPVGKDDDNGQYSSGYEEHKQQVDPKFAVLDESMTFQHPQVSLLSFQAFDPCEHNADTNACRNGPKTKTLVTMFKVPVTVSTPSVPLPACPWTEKSVSSLVRHEVWAT